MKIALLNDTHFGVRNDSPAFIKYQNRFYDELFFPYIIENKIDTLIHLGDVVDRRKFINHNTAHNFKKVFWDKLDKLNIKTYVIIGNHDTYYKNTNEVNALQNLEISKNTEVFTKATELEFDGLKVLFIPWICDDNETESVETIKNSTSPIAMGHLEIKGFEMHNGHYNDHGQEKAMFKRFEKVLSGHFHKKSDDGQIYYLGTQYEMTWSDYMCPKGFHIFDTVDKTLERIVNPFTIFEKIYYDDTATDYSKIDVSQYKDKFIKLVVVNKKDLYQFDRFTDRLLQEQTHEVKIVEDFSDLDAENVSDDIAENTQDTTTLLEKYIDELDVDLDKKRLKNTMKALYLEACDLEL